MKKGQSLEEHELFSAMPPLEALKMLCSLMTLKAFEIKIIGISRAHSYGKSRRPVYTNLPPGREQEVCKAVEDNVRNSRCQFMSGRKPTVSW